MMLCRNGYVLLSKFIRRRCASRVICDEIRLATYKEKLACFTRLIPVCISLQWVFRTKCKKTILKYGSHYSRWKQEVFSRYCTQNIPCVEHHESKQERHLSSWSEYSVLFTITSSKAGFMIILIFYSSLSVNVTFSNL